MKLNLTGPTVRPLLSGVRRWRPKVTVEVEVGVAIEKECMWSGANQSRSPSRPPCPPTTNGECKIVKVFWLLCTARNRFVARHICFLTFTVNRKLEVELATASGTIPSAACENEAQNLPLTCFGAQFPRPGSSVSKCTAPTGGITQAIFIQETRTRQSPSP